MNKRVIRYKGIVNQSAISIDSKLEGNTRYRFSLTIPFIRPGNKSAIVVMMNPSEATAIVSDSTVNNVLTRIHNECSEVSEVTIANLYPLYETYSEKLVNHKENSETNFKKMQSLMARSGLVVFGWGKPLKKNKVDLANIRYHEHALKVIDIAKSEGLCAYVGGDLRDDLYPRHLGRLGFDIKITPVDLSILSKKINSEISS